MNGDPSQFAKILEWGWTLILGLVALIWRQQSGSIHALERRIDKLEHANGKAATKGDVERLEKMINEHNRKLDETIERNHQAFMTLMRRQD